jgi:hypothetical protein
LIALAVKKGCVEMAGETIPQAKIEDDKMKIETMERPGSAKQMNRSMSKKRN